MGAVVHGGADGAPAACCSRSTRASTRAPGCGCGVRVGGAPRSRRRPASTASRPRATRACRRRRRVRARRARQAGCTSRRSRSAAEASSATARSSGATEVGDDSLVGVLTTAPRKRPDGTTWLGSPALELPRVADAVDPARTIDPPRGLVAARGATELVRILLPERSQWSSASSCSPCSRRSAARRDRRDGRRRAGRVARRRASSRWRSPSRSSGC